MSLKSNVSSRVSNALLLKLNKVREKIKKDNDIYISEEHRELCYNYKKYKEMLSNIQMTEKKITFNYKADTINDFETEIQLLQDSIDLDLDTHDDYIDMSYKHIISYNNYNHKYINIINKFINIDYIKEFLQEQDEFILSLTLRELSNLKNIQKASEFIYDYLNNNVSSNKFENIETLFFYQFKDYFDKKQIIDDIDTSNVKEFIDIISKNKDNIPLEVFNSIIENYIKEINQIFKKAPKTKEIIYLYATFENNFIVKNSNKIDGTYKSKEFVITSLFPDIEIQKMKNPNSVLYEIKVEKGLPLIFIGGITSQKNKMNVLISHNSTFYIDYVSKIIKYNNDLKDICKNKKSKDINITSLIYYDTKLTATRKSSFVSVSKSLMGKLEKVRNKIKEDNDIYTSKEHALVCYHYNKYQELADKIKMVEKKINLEYLTDNINTNSQQNFLEKDKIDFKKKSSEIVIGYNEYNHKFINRIQRIINFNHLNELLQEQDEFIKSLSIRELYNLKHYTYQGDKLIVEFINKTFSIEFLEINYNISTLLYFQFLDYFSHNPVFKDKQVDLDDTKEFLKFIYINYKNFSNDIYNQVITSYIQELNEIFKKAPKTKEVMYVYRGVKDNYISKEVSKNKSKGFFVSNRFTSTSLLLSSAITFIKTPDSVLYEIKIEKGLPVIFLNGISFISNEFEILLPINSTFYIDYALKIETYYNNKNLICNENKNSKEIKMTSLVYIK
jgi:hypothetical protein